MVTVTNFVIPETPVGAVVEKLATCLCAQILADGLPPPCQCGVIAGAGVSTDVGHCDEADGLAYVRLVNTYPASEVGVTDLTPGNCATGTGFDLEVGLYRCFPLEEDGTMPDAETQLESARLQWADEQAMRKAINCCEWLNAKDFVVGTYTPFGPEGGVLGGIIPISGWLP